MTVMFFLILVSLLVAAGFLLVFVWAARNGQFDDDYTPAYRILFDDQPTVKTEQPETEEAPKA